jgi:hypothetical protein
MADILKELRRDPGDGLNNMAADEIERLRKHIIPVCAVTGLIAGDSDACDDCDPCGAAHVVPDVVKRLIAEKEGWRRKYGEAAASADAALSALQRAPSRDAVLEVLKDFRARRAKYIVGCPTGGLFESLPAGLTHEAEAEAIASIVADQREVKR